ncbi:MAG TPA: hypothetical protein VF188_03850 [Longimicrobiales bacterium]
MTKYLRSAAGLATLVLASAGVASAQATTQTVTFEVQAINEIAVSGDPGSLVISSATAGGAPDPVTDASTTYDITTNETGKTITAVLDAVMPTGLTLTIELVAPSVGTSAGPVTLTDVAANAVTGISNVAETGLGITYTLSATAAAAVTATPQTRTVTLTII